MNTYRIIDRSLLILVSLTLALGGLLSAPPFAYADSLSGNALNFDGVNTWVDASQNGGATNSAANLGLPTQNITVEAWVNPRTFTAWTSLATFIQDNGSSEYGWGLGIYDASGRYYFGLAGVDGAITYLTTGNTFPANQWTHIAGVYDGTTMQIFVNGVLEGTSTAESGAIAYANSWLAIGAYRDDNEFYPLDGQLDEVRIWNTARTAAEIRANMFKELGATTGLVAVYHLNESSGATAADSSGNAHTGTLTNFTGTPWRTSGAFAGPRNALDFDGSNGYVSTANSIPADSPFTVEAWVYHSGGTFSTGYETIVEFGNDTPYLGLLNGSPVFYQTCTASQALQHNRWYHLAWVRYSSSSYALYVDGVQACYSTTTSASFTGADMGIGFNAGDTHWTGKIDEVRFWNTGRTAAQIRDDMMHQLVGNESGLVAYYRFDQGLAGGTNTGNNILYDLTSNAQDGTLNGFALTGAASNWVTSSAFNTWIGADSTDWATASNWSRNAAPVAADNVGLYNEGLSNPPTLNTAATVDDLMVGTGATLSLGGSAALAVTGNWMNYGAFTPNGKTVTFSGSAAQAILGATTFYNLNIANTAGAPDAAADVNSSAAVAVSNTLTVSDGQFRPAAGSAFKDVNIGAAAGVFKPAASASISVGGNWTNSGTFTHNNGMVTFNGGGTQNLTANTVTTFNNLTVNSGAIVSETIDANNVAVAGTLTNHGRIQKSKAIGATGVYTFGLASGPINGALLSIDVTTDNLASLTVDRYDSQHSAFTGSSEASGIGYARYWTLTPDGTGTVNLTLPANFSTGENSKVCRYTGTGTVWDCVMNSYTLNTVTRNGITTFSDWAAGNAGPTAVTLHDFTAKASAPWGVIGLLAVALAALGALLIGRRVTAKSRP
jgi:hypothetical protein